MNKAFSRLLCVAVAASLLSACSHGAQKSIPASRTGQTVHQPAPVDAGDPPARGSTYVNTQCSASDSTCAGPWQNGQTGTDTWESASPNGQGHWAQTLLCSSVASCAAYGYYNTIAYYVTTWKWDINNTGGGGPPNIDEVDTGYSPDCDPSTSDSFPDGCSIAALATPGYKALPGSNCLGSPLAIGAVPGSNKPDTYSNDINQIYYIKAAGLAGGVGMLYGWVYQTAGDGYYLQPNMSVTITGGVPVAQIGVATNTPWVPIGGITPAQLVGGINAAANVMQVTSLPNSFGKVIGSGIKVTALPCFVAPWDGKYTAGKKRRV